MRNICKKCGDPMRGRGEFHDRCAPNSEAERRAIDNAAEDRAMHEADMEADRG